MLHKLPELHKRSYLARFLVNIDVPEHMFADEEVVETYQHYKDLQEEFKETHKMSEKFKSQLISPAEIKRAIVQMEDDKNMLEQKVEALHSKLQATERFPEMLDAASKLRLEQDEQVQPTWPSSAECSKLEETQKLERSTKALLNKARALARPIPDAEPPSGPDSPAHASARSSRPKSSRSSPTSSSTSTSRIVRTW